jgi:hypothetical protein
MSMSSFPLPISLLSGFTHHWDIQNAEIVTYVQLDTVQTGGKEYRV